MTIRTRLYLIFAAMLVITLAASVQSWKTVSAYGDFNTRARELARSALEAEKILSLAYRHADLVRFSPLGEEPPDVYDYESSVNGLLETLFRKAQSSGSKDVIAIIRELRRAYEDLADLLFEEAERRATGEMASSVQAEQWYTEHRRALEKVREIASRLVRKYEGDLLTQNNAAVLTGFRALLTIATASLLAVLVLTVLLLAVGRWLLSPLGRVAAAAERIGSGDLQHRLENLPNDEIGALGRSFNEMADKLHHHQQRLLEARELVIIGAMSSSVAHGLRNPLAGIRAAAQFMAGTMTEDHPARERVGDIIDEVDRMTRRITDLLDFGRPAETKPETVPLRELIASGIAEAQATLDRHEMIVTIDVNDFTVYVDRDKIVQILAELLTNAAVHAGDGVPVAITARLLPAEQGRHPEIELTVSDRGRGADAATIEHAFDLFFSTRPGGSGMGLACAKRMVELHGGRMQMHSQPGRGTRVSFSLPLSAPRATDSGPLGADI
jgi:signal transduction histidine kinase